MILLPSSFVEIPCPPLILTIPASLIFKTAPPSAAKPIEVTVTCKDGTTREISVQASSIGETNIITLIDLTDRKQIEEELKASEERFKILSEATFEGIQIHDQGIVLDANQSFVDMLGYDSVDEIIGKDIMSKHLTPESQTIVRNAHESDYEGRYEYDSKPCRYM